MYAYIQLANHNFTNTIYCIVKQTWPYILWQTSVRDTITLDLAIVYSLAFPKAIKITLKGETIMEIKFKMDTKKLEKALKKEADAFVNKSINNIAVTHKFNINCPHCNAKIMGHAGKHLCPFCYKEINLKVNRPHL